MYISFDSQGYCVTKKRRIVSGESWRQTYMDNGVGADREKDGST